MNGCDHLTSAHTAANCKGVPPAQASNAAASVGGPSVEASDRASPSAGCIDLALSILDEHFEQLAAVAITLENRLADECERVKDGGPLIDWRLAQVLSDKLTSTKVQREVACLLGREMAGQEP